MQIVFALALVAQPVQPQVITARVRGSIESTLVRQHRAQGQALAAQVARLLRWRGDVVEDVHPGDRIRLAWSNDDEGQTVLVSLRYRGRGLKLEAFRFEDRDGTARYFDADGLLVEPRLQNTPVPSTIQITEDVQNGPGRRAHNGLDLKAPIGAPIFTPFAAIVTRTNWSTTINGNCVELTYTSSGIIARFLHLEAIDPDVYPGQELAAGREIGTVGNTGRSSAPHLHYELRTVDGEVLRPLEVHGTEEVTVSAERAGRFRAWVKAQRRLLEGARNRE